MNWKQILEIARHEDSTFQYENKARILEAFREMWKSNPTEKEFADYIKGTVMFPEELFIMVRG